MIKGDWEVWNTEKEDRDKWLIQLQCANEDCPSSSGEPMVYIEVPLYVSYEPEDRSVGISGGWLAEAITNPPKACWCGNPMPSEQEIEQEVQDEVARWAEDQFDDDPRDEYNREDEFDR